jgi:hypothetical protein
MQYYNSLNLQTGHTKGVSVMLLLADAVMNGHAPRCAICSETRALVASIAGRAHVKCSEHALALHTAQFACWLCSDLAAGWFSCQW